MENYEIVIRLHDPSFEKTVKRAIPYPRVQALQIWDDAKIHKKPVEVQDGSEMYLLSPTDVLQVRQALGDSSGTSKTSVGNYKRKLIFSTKETDKVFEIVRTKKLQKGWEDPEYKEIDRIPEQEWGALDRQDQDKHLEELRNTHMRMRQNAS